MSNSIDYAVETLRQANPVPDPTDLADAMRRPSVFLATTKEKTMGLNTDQSTQTDPTQKRPRKPGKALALVGGIAIAVIAVGLVATMNNDDSISLAGASDDPAATAAFAAVEDAYLAFNSGDSRWVEIRNSGSAYDSVRYQELVEEHLLALYAASHAADARIDVRGCTSHGLASWPEVADDGPVFGHKFTCNAVRTDSFHGGAGMQLDEPFVWVVSDGEIIAVTSEGDSDARFGPANHQLGLTDQFYFWLADAHPRVASEMTFVEWQAIRVFPSIESLPIALEYVDEFVAAQS